MGLTFKQSDSDRKASCLRLAFETFLFQVIKPMTGLCIIRLGPVVPGQSSILFQAEFLRSRILKVYARLGICCQLGLALTSQGLFRAFCNRSANEPKNETINARKILQPKMNAAIAMASMKGRASAPPFPWLHRLSLNSSRNIQHNHISWASFSAHCNCSPRRFFVLEKQMSFVNNQRYLCLRYLKYLTSGVKCQLCYKKEFTYGLNGILEVPISVLQSIC